MQIQAYQVYIPLEIEDIIKIKGIEEKFEVLDILHTYSALERTIVKVELELKNLTTEEIVTKPYNENMMELVKDE